MWKRNLVKSADAVEIAEMKKAEQVKAEANAKAVEDAFALRAKARRVAFEDVSREEMVPGALEFVIDALRTIRAPWTLLEEKWDEIISRPGAGIALTELLVYSEWLTNQEQDDDAAHILFNNMLGMFSKIVFAARSRLTIYREILASNREHKGERGYEPLEIDDRPADIYRDFGGALRWIWTNYTEENARRVLAELQLETTMPLNELDNPDWIDAYTGRGDAAYEQIRLKKSEVSSDGNIPMYVADLMEDLGYGSVERFETLNGCSMDEYNRQRLEAQRSGYNEAVGQELEQENGADDYDSLEKDFQFNSDLKVEWDTVKALQLRFADEIKGVRGQIDAAGKAFEEWLKVQKNAEKRTKYDWDVAHQRFLAAKETKAFLKAAQKFLSGGLPQELMAIMLPLQNTFGFWEDDLYTLTIPRSGVGYSLANWYEVFGDEFLEQYMGSEDSPNYDDVPMELLDQIAWELTAQMQDAYNKSEERRVEYAAKKGLKYKTDTRWTAAFVNAEVQTAIMGEGGNNSAQAAGWDAWRAGIDPEANRVFKRLVAKGSTQKEAMAEFWKVVNANRNKIATVNRDGITLKSGRKIDWGIARLKITQGEIVLDLAETNRLIELLKKFSIGGTLMPTLVKRVTMLENLEKVLVLQPQ